MMERMTNGLRRSMSFILVLAMMLSLLPAVPMLTGATVNAASQSVTVYFKDTDGWGDVYGYAWDNNGTLTGEWPGTALTRGEGGLYALTVSYNNTSSNKFNFIFNNNDGKQTADLTLSNSQLQSGNDWWVNGPSNKPAKCAPPKISGNTVTFTYEGSGTNVYVAGSMNGWSSSANKMTKSGSVFTCSMELPAGQYEYKFVVDSNWINDPANPQTVSDGSGNTNNYIVMPGMAAVTIPGTKGAAIQLPKELDCVTQEGATVRKAVSYKLATSDSNVTLSGTALTVKDAYTGTTVALTASTTDGFSCAVTVDLDTTAQKTTKVKVHFINAAAWDSVAVYGWTDSGDVTGQWPGNVMTRDGNGYFVAELSHAFASGEKLGLSFHNMKGAQTKDVTVAASKLSAGEVELWVQPSATAGSDGKHTATTSDTLASQFLSTEVNGDQVTFRYKGTGTNVYLAGTFNNWSTSSTKMTKSGSIFSATVTLTPGVHEYKFVVDGNWITDPGNAKVGGYDNNSVLVVPSGNAPQDNGKVTVKLHFYRSGGYTDWDVWYWAGNANGAAAQLQSVTGDKGRVATFTVDGRNNANVGFIVRKGNWADQEFSDRFIDLSDVSSGTVHYFVNAGTWEGSRVLDTDVVGCAKPVSALLEYDSGKILVGLSVPYTGALTSAFSITGPDSAVKVTGVEVTSGGYLLHTTRRLTLNELSDYQVVFNGLKVGIGTKDLFYSKYFAQEYTYDGDDLGAVYSKTSTTFKVWAPTAKSAHVKIYASGNYGNNDQQQYVTMKLGEKGVWYVTVSGDLHGKYYNFDIGHNGYTVEATDPYAKAVGANGDRGMILDMDKTDPAGWENDISPNQGMSLTDAIIYEMHVREMTIDASSGVKEDWKGTYLGLTQSGTTYDGRATGLDHLKELGVSHVQLMPVYDFNSSDEYKLDQWEQYAWGYDPKNYNAPDGSYSTDPFNGATRITEFKTMVQTLHKNGINVVMDVVYNHAFDGGNFCGNKIVPNYYSRFFGEGNWSNGSGCGNDIATERSMVRNMIVDSVMHWIEEYHIDGFRFDLAGLIDTQTINEIVSTVRAKYPNVLLYGEGWGSGDTAVEYGYDLATKGNAWAVGGFGFFNDDFRNAIAGHNGNSWGFATGSGDYEDAIANYFRASNGWSTDPKQTLNYVSCHDNYCLMDKIILSKNGSSWQDMVKMGNLSTAILMMAQGTPFIYSGEELLREKKDANGNRYDNAFGTDDYINKIRWSDLKSKTYCQVTDDYYGGLIEFRKNHAALRCPGGAEAWNNVTYHRISDQVILFYIGGGVNGEVSDGIVIIYNAGSSSANVDLSRYGIPAGKWQACVHGDKAGIDALWSMDVGSGSSNVGVDAISTTILVKGDLKDEGSVYNRNLELVNKEPEKPVEPAKPEAPVISSCYSKEQTSVKITWTAVEGADGYQVYRSETPDGSSGWKSVKTVKDGKQTSYTTQSLTVGVTYYYKVRAYIQNGSERIYSDFSEVKF
ncbi:MAG: type I pullulanase, partial [Oscillospiraceae bacterium]|nr:type I pullulanase [Oscillospiraceae bacterium]